MKRICAYLILVLMEVHVRHQVVIIIVNVQVVTVEYNVNSMVRIVGLNSVNENLYLYV